MYREILRSEERPSNAAIGFFSSLLDLAVSSLRRAARRPTGWWAVGAVLVVGVCVLRPAAAAQPTIPDPTDLKTADALAATGSSPARDRALKRWAEQRASLTDLVYVLRRPASELGSAEALLAAGALARTPASREALR